MKKYSAIGSFKRDYPYFVLFIREGEEYRTFDSDAKILMYLYNTYHEDIE